MSRLSAVYVPVVVAALTLAATPSFSGLADDRSIEKNAPSEDADRPQSTFTAPDADAEDAPAAGSQDTREHAAVVERDDDVSERIAAPRAPLSDEAIADALRHGRSERGQNQGLVLRDSGRAVMNVLNSLADEPTEGSGFWIEVYTPASWLAQLSSDAAREYHDLSPRDLVAEDLSAVLRVVVHPDMPDRVSRRGMRLSASVEHVVIRPRGDRGAPALHPLSKREFDETTVGRHGRRATFSGVEATFDLAAVTEALRASRDGELDVIIIGSRDREKTFSIKKKHFKDLPGLNRF